MLRPTMAVLYSALVEGKLDRRLIVERIKSRDAESADGNDDAGSDRGGGDQLQSGLQRKIVQQGIATAVVWLASRLFI